jgi:hypothetical protein
MHQENKTLKASFDLPDFLSMAAYDRWNAASAAHPEIKELTDFAKIYAVYFGLGLESGLVTNWQSETMPDPETQDLEQIDVQVVLWAGELVAEWVISRQRIPKN